MDVLIQGIVVFGAIMIGVRIGGVGLGICGGAGLMILTTVLGLTPSKPPIDVLLIIMAVVTAASVMHTAGGIDYMVRIAEKIIRANPKRIVFVAPLVTWFFSFLGGTANICQALMPVIYEVSYAMKIRPERAMTTSAIAAQQSLVASPVAACTAALLGLLVSQGSKITLGQIMAVTVPATLVAVLVTATVMSFYGKDLDKDEEYLQRVKEGLVQPPKPIEHKPLPWTAGFSALLFVGGVVFAVLGGFFPEIRTPASGKAMGMGTFLQISMLTAAFLIIVVCKPQVKNVMTSPIMRAGMTAVIVIFGVAWMADTFISAHKKVWLEALGGYIQAFPLLFGVFLFFGSSFLNSQAATVRAIMPLGIALGLPPATLVGLYPGCNGTSFFPTSGPVISTLQFDQSGTVHIGKYVLNHSFIFPCVTATTTATVVGYLLSQVIL